MAAASCLGRKPGVAAARAAGAGSRGICESTHPARKRRNEHSPEGKSSGLGEPQNCPKPRPPLVLLAQPPVSPQSRSGGIPNGRGRGTAASPSPWSCVRTGGRSPVPAAPSRAGPRQHEQLHVTGVGKCSAGALEEAAPPALLRAPSSPALHPAPSQQAARVEVVWFLIAINLFVFYPSYSV